MQIAILSSDPNLVPLAASLVEHGIRVERCARLADVAELAELYPIDMLLIDSGAIGAAVASVRAFRERQRRMPIMIVGRPLNTEQAVGFFSSGVDDIVCGAVPGELMAARIRAIVRRCRGSDASAMVLGPLRFDMIRRSLEVNDVPVVLTNKEYELLELMMTRKGITLTKDLLLDHLYGGRDAPEARIIDVFVCKLRRKLADLGVHDLIRTVRGLGYRLDEQGCRVQPAAAVPSLPAAVAMPSMSAGMLCGIAQAA
ncbi:winged helix-turn-helix transcriptional regulator [Rhizosaccharibacter radicis]|uniref:Response regulator transcription factor n=1 Tax=Rhizosaccharibacter radicis TaxID=2782605 RepID=A0ABT1VUN5_9PROT|nr:response regulator transcription factor [Acetobacteraceae bacterium KSS12]